jgi:hypothetical protein
MTNVFRRVNDSIADSPLIILVIMASIFGIATGAALYGEDFMSSYYGVQGIQNHYTVKPASYPIIYVAISGAPQIASIIFGYMWIADTTKTWAKYVFLGAEAFDFVSDLWYRAGDGKALVEFWVYLWSGSDALTQAGGDPALVTGAFVWSVIFGLVYSFFSVPMLVASLGIFLEGFEDSIIQFAKGYAGVRIALIRARAAVNKVYNDNETQTAGTRTPRQQAAETLGIGNPQRDNRRS